MKSPRFQITLADGSERIIPSDQEGRFFKAIADLTGLDQAIAEPILLSGKPIEHPRATFRKYRKAEGQS